MRLITIREKSRLGKKADVLSPKTGREENGERKRERGEKKRKERKRRIALDQDEIEEKAIAAAEKTIPQKHAVVQ